MKYLIISLTLFSLSQTVFAADGRGKISSLFFASANNGSHPDIVQFRIEGGFNKTGCNNVYAAVRKSDEHLVSAVLSAKMSKSVVEVYLDSSDIYYNVAGNEPNRCIASAISIP